MNIIIYPGSEGNTEHFRAFSYMNSIQIVEDCDAIGDFLALKASFNYKEELIKSISEFITEVYLENYILCKIYDEYPSVNIIEASDILRGFVSTLTNSYLKSALDCLIKNNARFNLPSFVLFNIKQIMLTTNRNVEKLCEDLISHKSNELLLSYIDEHYQPLISAERAGGISVISDNVTDCELSKEDVVDIKHE